MAKGYLISPNSVRALARLLRGSSGDTTGGGGPATVSPDRTPPPYTLRYAASISSGEGGWIIYLSADSLVYDTSTVALTTDLTAAGTPYPAGWYKVPDDALASTGGTLYLVVKVPKEEEPESGSSGSSSGSSSSSSSSGSSSGSSSDIEAEFASTPGTDSSTYTAYNYVVAYAERDTSTGVVKVKQNLVGALAIGGGGAGGGGLSGEVDFIGALLYNNTTSTQQVIDPDSSSPDYALYARTDTLDLATGAVNQGAWSKVFDTTPHENIYN